MGLVVGLQPRAAQRAVVQLGRRPLNGYQTHLLPRHLSSSPSLRRQLLDLFPDGSKRSWRPADVGFSKGQQRESGGWHPMVSSNSKSSVNGKTTGMLQQPCTLVPAAARRMSPFPVQRPASVLPLW